MQYNVMVGSWQQLAS